MKTFDEYKSSLLSAFNKSSDEDLLNILKESFCYNGEDYYTPGDQSICISELQECGTTIFELLDDTNSNPFGASDESQILQKKLLANLLLDNKKQSFELLKDQFQFNATCYWAYREDDVLEGFTEEEINNTLHTWRNDSSSNVLVDDEEYVYSCYSIEDCEIPISQVDFGYLINSMKLDDDSITLIFDRAIIFGNDDRVYEEKCSRKDYGNCSLEKNKVSIKIPRDNKKNILNKGEMGKTNIDSPISKKIESIADDSSVSFFHKSDDELIELLCSKDYNEDHSDDGNIHSNTHGFHILALLAAAKKEKAFEDLRNKLIKTNSINGFNGYIRYLSPDDDEFDSKEEEMAIRSNPRFIFIKEKDEFGLSLENLYQLMSGPVSVSDFGEDCSIDISQIDYEFIKSRLIINQDHFTIRLPKNLFGNLYEIKYKISNVTKDEFGELPKDTQDVIITIGFESSEDLLPLVISNSNQKTSADRSINPIHELPVFDLSKQAETPKSPQISKNSLTTKLEVILHQEALDYLLSNFTDQGVTDSILGDLTDGDLKDLGIIKLGERKRLLGAFKEELTTVQTDNHSRSEHVETKQNATDESLFSIDAQNGELIITGFRGQGHVVIPNKFNGTEFPVREIGSGAFKDNGFLVSVLIPESITRINDDAFANCSSLISVNLPDSLTHVGARAFDGCINLQTSPKPLDLPSVGSDAFRGWGGITSLKIPEGIKNLKRNAFSGWSSLKEIFLPDDIETIGYAAFDGCSSLESINIPEGVKIIDDIAFQYCTSLKSIVLPDSVREIGIGAFSYCSDLIHINIPKHIVNIKKSTFAYCDSLESINIPERVGTIGESAFDECNRLKTINIPATVTSIGEFAFSPCHSLKSVSIPDTVTNIHKYAFNDNICTIKIVKSESKTISYGLVDEISKKDDTIESEINYKGPEQLLQLLQELGTHSRIFVNPNIPETRLKNARKNIVKNNDEEILMLYDNSLFENGKAGLVITSSGIFYKNTIFSPEYMSFEKIKEIEVKQDKWVHINKNQAFSFVMLQQQGDDEFINKIIRILKLASVIVS